MNIFPYSQYCKDTALEHLGVLWDYLDVLELKQVLDRLVRNLQGDGILARLLPLWDVLVEPRSNKVLPRQNYN